MPLDSTTRRSTRAPLDYSLLVYSLLDYMLLTNRASLAAQSLSQQLRRVDAHERGTNHTTKWSQGDSPNWVVRGCLHVDGRPACRTGRV